MQTQNEEGTSLQAIVPGCCVLVSQTKTVSFIKPFKNLKYAQCGWDMNERMYDMGNLAELCHLQSRW